MKESPLEPNKKEATAAKQERYQRMSSLIIFSMIETGPDITFATSVVSQFAKNPSYQYSKVVKTILQYLKAIKETRITYREKQGGDLIIKEYSNSDLAGDHITRKSISRYIFMLNRGSVNWYSKVPIYGNPHFYGS